MAEPLGFHQLFDAHASDTADAADVVAPEIDQHGVLGAFFWIGAHLRFQPQVLVVRRASPPRAGDRPQRHLAGSDLDEKLRRGPEQLTAAEPQIEMVRRRAGCPERAVEGKPVAVGQLEALAEDDLEDVARADVLQRAPHGGLELPFTAADRLRLGQPAFQEARAVALVAEETRAERLRRRRP